MQTIGTVQLSDSDYEFALNALINYAAIAPTQTTRQANHLRLLGKLIKKLERKRPSANKPVS